MSEKIAIVIPARMGSSRFPGKPLVDLAGKPMIQWVVEAARASDVTDTILVATPDQEIFDACRAFGAEAILTGANHISGTDRIAEVAQRRPADIFVNIQGDEPLIDPEAIQACAKLLVDSSSVQMSSLFCPCPAEDFENPAAVKVVTDLDGFALYFSRYPVPYPRNSRQSAVKKHIGIYGYRTGPLAAFASWRPTPLELTESLEQLRFVEHGTKIKMGESTAVEVSVDTPEQAQQARLLLLSRAGRS